MNLLEQETHPTTDYRIAYCAGYFDGEGCIHVSKNGPGGDMRLMVLITSGDKESLLVFEKLFGGSVIPRKIGKDGKRQMFTWRCNGLVAVETLRIMEPFMIAKRPQAQLVLQRGWHSNKHGQSLNATDVFNRKAICDGLKSLKTKSYATYQSVRSF